MAKFSAKNVRTNPISAIKTLRTRALTHERGLGYEPNLETELFLMAATYMAGENSFYESASAREERFVDLVHQVTADNPDFIVRFAPYLRNELKIRSASVMLAAEYVAAGGEGGRAVVNSVLQRGDEPAEMLGYWQSRYGRSMKMAVKRGIADAVVRLYNERSALRYDGTGRGIRMADVIELTHPKTRDAQQNALFKWLLDHRHHNDAVADPRLLPVLAAAKAQADVAPEARREALRENGPEALAKAGVSWERLSAWLGDGMDAEAWESVIPTMGVMALIRNLRNFDEQGVSQAAIDVVTDRITHAASVARARIFPYQVWAAYKYAPSDTWKTALGTTLQLTTANVPRLDRTLVVIDMSGSMQAPVAGKSRMSRVEVASLMASVTAARSPKTDVVIFGHSNKTVKLPKGASVLGNVERIMALLGSVGHATYGHTAIRDHFDARRHDRVVMFTDDQMQDAGRVNIDNVPVIYTIDLAGYRPRSMPTGSKGRYTLAGFSDATFTLMETLESGPFGFASLTEFRPSGQNLAADGDWPF